MFHRRKSGTGSDPPGLLFLPPVATPTTRHLGRTSFSFSEPEADKDKEAKRNPLTHRIFSQAPHSFFSQSTGKNGQVARLDLAGFACNLHTFGSYSTQKSCMKSVLSHNHPSGSTVASTLDNNLTSQLKKGCEAIGIHLLDHIILTEDSYLSYADEGML